MHFNINTFQFRNIHPSFISCLFSKLGVFEPSKLTLKVLNSILVSHSWLTFLLVIRSMASSSYSSINANRIHGKIDVSSNLCKIHQVLYQDSCWVVAKLKNLKLGLSCVLEKSEDFSKFPDKFHMDLLHLIQKEHILP